jgi:hypothetical protein
LLMRDTSKSGGKKICSQSYQMQPCRVKSDGLLVGRSFLAMLLPKADCEIWGK